MKALPHPQNCTVPPLCTTPIVRLGSASSVVNVLAAPQLKTDGGGGWVEEKQQKEFGEPGHGGSVSGAHGFTCNWPYGVSIRAPVGCAHKRTKSDWSNLRRGLARARVPSHRVERCEISPAVLALLRGGNMQRGRQADQQLVPHQREASLTGGFQYVRSLAIHL